MILESNVQQCICKSGAYCDISEQVPYADGVVVRVINNVHKKFDVKARYLEAFRHEGFPEVLPFKQKVHTLAPAS